jgi:NAD(P)H-quinone oxidoreductase subunit 4
MLREVFYGSGADQVCDVMPSCELSDLDLKNQGNEEAACFGNNCDLPINARFEDANPREVFIALCFLALIVAIGVYPKLATGMYDATTLAVNAQARQSFQQVAEANPQIYAWTAGHSAVAESQSAPVLGVVK